jgi:hypothetical protein
MIFVSSVKEDFIHLMGVFECQTPFEHFHLNTAINPSELEIGFKIRGIYSDEIFASNILLMEGAVTPPRIPEKDRSFWTDQPESGVVAPCRSIHDDDLE